ncbi:hypothetical protein [Crocosphaera chwakensis]|uniref:Uncharacterized protein n=1 Tax=Crocosphaera chwakensis CCY0110 TaxID=391612 RepID=A3IQ67_9CHRO|nr:hypothetical protein [Crocosphaera chwakensis]EAZ91407.1 hypothetical protein CY0110_05537 [Crocosphaera chwakensis CCY0110]
MDKIFDSQDNGESLSSVVENDVFNSPTSEDTESLVTPFVEELIKISVNIMYAELKLTIEDFKKQVNSNARAIEALTNNFTEFQQIQENQSNQVMTIIRELQERQIQLQDTQERERETLETITKEMTRFIIKFNTNKNRIEQLTGYSLSNESDHLDIQQRLMNLEARINELENQS